MSLILKSDDFSVPESSALLMRGLQTDLFGEVLGGHKAIFDPLQSDVLGTLPIGSELPNLIFNKAGATAITNVVSQSISTAKGVPFSPGESAQYLSLPNYFNMVNLGSEPSVVISVWLTHRDLTQTIKGICGCTFQTSTYAQWYMCTGSVAGKFRFGFQGLSYEFVAELDTPHLYSIYFSRTAAGQMRIQCAVDLNIVHTALSTYPFRNPGESSNPSAATAKMGYADGLGYQWNGVVHRIQCVKVDPTHFNFTQWLSDECVNNEGRFVV